MHVVKHYFFKGQAGETEKLVGMHRYFMPTVNNEQANNKKFHELPHAW